MTYEPKLTSAQGRFARVLGLAPGSRPLHDRPLLEAEDWVAAPSLGALMPGWLLVLPRRPSLNFQEWARSGQDPINVLADVSSRLGLGSSEYIWFEHGPKDTGTVVGCGVDYAHLHVLIRPPFDFQHLLDKVSADPRLRWRAATASQAYARLERSDSYFILGHGSHACVATNVEVAGSQYVRRAIAELVGLKDDWNYKDFPHTDNIQATVDLVEELRGAVRR